MKRRAELALSETSARQQGIFTRKQALAAGYSGSTIDNLINQGLFISVHPSIYRDAGTPQTWLGDLSAAVLWAHSAAAACRAAASLHKLPGFDDPPLEIVTSTHRISSRCGIIVHHTKRLPTEQLVVRAGIRCTSVERTLLDLCGFEHRRRAAIALDHALHRGLTSIGSLDFCLFMTARRGRNGCGVLRELIKARWDLTEFPNTPLETVIWDMYAGSPIKRPELQVPIFDERGEFVARPDFLYPDEKLVIEGHSKLWHRGYELEQSDRERHLRLTRLDFEIVYLSWADAVSFPETTLMMIDRKLGERAALLGLRNHPDSAAWSPAHKAAD